MLNRKNKAFSILYLLCGLVFFLPSGARAQLSGTDTTPGSSCVGFPTGSTRLTADANTDGNMVTLICNGATWEQEGLVAVSKTGGAPVADGGGGNLGDLNNVDLSSLSDGDCITFNSSAGNWESASTCGGGGGSSIWSDSGSGFIEYSSTLGGVQINSVVGAAPPVGALGSSGGGGASAMNDLTDVDTTGVSNDDVLLYSGGSWVVGAQSGGGSSLWSDSGSGYIEYSNALGGIKVGNVSGEPAPVVNGVGFNLNDLGDVDTSGVSDDDVLLYSAGSWTVGAGGGGGGSADLAGLTDTTITAPSSGQILSYNGSAWVNSNSSGGGGGGSGSGTYGTVTFTGSTNCVWQAGGASWQSYAADADCNSATTTGDALAPTGGKVPAMRFTNLPAGQYRVAIDDYFRYWYTFVDHTGASEFGRARMKEISAQTVDVKAEQVDEDEEDGTSDSMVNGDINGDVNGSR